MVKHIILWKLKDEFTQEEKQQIKTNIKQQLESLNGRIPGLLDLNVVTDGLASSNTDLMLDSSFENEQALIVYANHPDHVHVANTYVRPYTAIRSCLDFNA